MAFGIWSMVCCALLGIAVHCCRAEQPVGFFTAEKPPQVRDVKRYNLAVAKIWAVFALLLEAAGVPLLFAGQNNPLALLCILAVPPLVIGSMAAYLRVAEKYKQAP